MSSSEKTTAERAKAAKEALERGLAALQTAEDWKGVLRMAGTLGKLSGRRYSFANQMLLLLQGADLTAVAGFKTWLAHDRHVRKGEKAYWILAPAPFKKTKQDANGNTVQVHGVFFRGTSVFDIRQTDGEPLTRPEVPAIEASDREFDQTVERLHDVAMSLEGAPVSSIEFHETDPHGHGAYGWYERATRKIIVVTGGRSKGEQFATLCHEIAHAILHGTEERHTRPVKEVEAESVAFIVCHALGLDTSKFSFPYVASWAENGGDPATKIVAKTGERIVKAANAILDAIEGKSGAKQEEAA